MVRELWIFNIDALKYMTDAHAIPNEYERTNESITSLPDKIAKMVSRIPIVISV